MRETPDAVMLFAAGFGTRMKELTKETPKPMIPVGGRPLIDHAMELVRDAGIPRTIANLHYKPALLQAHLEAQGVTCILEAPEILETGGGLRNALPLLGPEPVFTMNTDAIWCGPNPLRLLADAWNPDIMDALLIGIPPAQAVGHSGAGDFTMDAAGQLMRGPGVIYGGAQIIKTEGLAAIQKHAFSLNLLWDQMRDAGRLFGLRYPGQWCDVGRPEGIGMAEDLLANADV